MQGSALLARRPLCTHARTRAPAPAREPAHPRTSAAVRNGAASRTTGTFTSLDRSSRLLGSRDQRDSARSERASQARSRSAARLSRGQARAATERSPHRWTHRRFGRRAGHARIRPRLPRSGGSIAGHTSRAAQATRGSGPGRHGVAAASPGTPRAPREPRCHGVAGQTADIGAGPVSTISEHAAGLWAAGHAETIGIGLLVRSPPEWHTVAGRPNAPPLRPAHTSLRAPTRAVRVAFSPRRRLTPPRAATSLAASASSGRPQSAAGLDTTAGCNLACRFCQFGSPSVPGPSRHPGPSRAADESTVSRR